MHFMTYMCAEVVGMPEPAHGTWEHYPVRWLNRHALVTLPERVGESNARPMHEQLLSIVDDDVLVLILDMTATTACDHAGGVALAQVYQRAVASGTELRPVVVDEGVRRVLTVSGVGRLVPVYDTVGAALAATRPDHNIAAAASGVPGRPGGRTESQSPGPAPRAAEDPDTEVALLDRDGVIVSVNDAWRAFAAANGGDPARTGPGVSYLDVCAAAADDPLAAQVASAIRDALTGDLPGSLTVEVPCHSPRTERWFDLLISARRDGRGRSAGATVTLSLTRARTRVLLPAGAGRPDGDEAPGAAADAALVGELTERLAGVARTLAESEAQAGANLAGQLRRARGELDAVIRDARTTIARRGPGRDR
jgi:anti-anti-sigma regulatory factor